MKDFTDNFTIVVCFIIGGLTLFFSIVAHNVIDCFENRVPVVETEFEKAMHMCNEMGTHETVACMNAWAKTNHETKPKSKCESASVTLDHQGNLSLNCQEVE